MSDEIKIITLGQLLDFVETEEKANILINYIANLQQENQKLLNENIALKDIRYMVEETIYKSRVEKAIKYIKSLNIFGLRSGKTLFGKILNDILELLQGGKDE